MGIGDRRTVGEAREIRCDPRGNGRGNARQVLGIDWGKTGERLAKSGRSWAARYL